MKETIGFIGLGGMGLAMATKLLKSGFRLRVYNRTAEKARPLIEQGAILARSPAEAAEPGGVVVTMVSDDRAVEEVTLGTDGLLGRLGNGVHLSMSTIAPRTARRLAGLHREQAAGYVASPVFGKPEVQPVGAQPSLIRKDYGLILEAAAEGLVPMPLANLIHDRLTATVAKGRDDIDWAGFAREVSESAGL